MDVFTTPGPAFLASALINGDESGLESPDDYETLNRFRAYVENAEVVDCGEPYFSWHFDLYGGSCRGGDLVEYTCIRRD